MENDSNKENKSLKEELDKLKSEVAVARERLGPAGYRIISEVASLRKELVEMTRERDELEKLNNDSVIEFCQKIAASKAREIALRGALEIIREWPLRDGKRVLPVQSVKIIANRALAAQDEPPLLGVLREVEDVLEMIGYPEAEFWKNLSKEAIFRAYKFDIERVKNCLLKLHNAIGRNK